MTKLWLLAGGGSNFVKSLKRPGSKQNDYVIHKGKVTKLKLFHYVKEKLNLARKVVIRIKRTARKVPSAMLSARNEITFS